MPWDREAGAKSPFSRHLFAMGDLAPDTEGYARLGSRYNGTQAMLAAAGLVEIAIGCQRNAADLGGSFTGGSWLRTWLGYAPGEPLGPG